MKTNIPISIWPGLLLVGASAALSGCQEAAPVKGEAVSQAAAMSIFADVSSSTAFITSPAYAEGAIKRVSAAVLKQQLGDTFRVVSLGSRTTDRAVDVLSLTSGYKKRLSAVSKQVETSLTNLFADSRQSGGDGSTNLLYTLVNAHPICTPRSTIVILSDGVEASESYSAIGALSAGQPVHLPPPSTPYLKGCSVNFIGIGISPMGGGQAETLTNDRLQALIAGYREYFQAAGVNPADMTFTSIL